MIKAPLLFLGLGLLALLSLAAAVALGSIDLGWENLWALLQGRGDILTRTVVLELRLPRALNAFAVGGLLALAGTFMQVLLRNPLADPYVLGISGGAAAAVLGAMLLGMGGLFLSGAACAGALLTMALVFALVRGADTWNPTRLLLTGVVMAAGWAALIGFILAISPDTTLRSMLFWLLGDLSDDGLSVPALIVLSGGLTLGLVVSRDMNLLSRGVLEARALGVSPDQLAGVLYITASLLTAAAVICAGTVGFVGLVVPHLIRLMSGSDHRILLPAAVLLGGSLVTNADTVARSLLAPQQLPVGVITALLGIPLFLYLLNRRAR